MRRPTFSFLLSVYFKDDPHVLSECLDSIVNQTDTADETIIIVEGKLSVELQEILETYKNKIDNCLIAELKSVPGPMNYGLPACLNYGIHLSSCEYILRIDSDDINDLDRVRVVRKFIEDHPNISLGSSNIIEFDESMSTECKSRVVPEKHEEILKFAKLRSPFNGPAAFFRREEAIMLGGYPLVGSNEDYCFWVKFLKHGLITQNIQKNLVKMRAGKEIIKRRSSKRYILGEWQSTRFLFGIGHYNFLLFITHLCLKSTLRLLPASFIQIIYNKVLRK